ncbi:hypothetical protein F5876DRAFT_25553, partial [Lentinula aff. lateritia]
TQKVERRLQIATAMMRIAQALNNREQYGCWSEIFDSISRLGTAGMSDDEQISDPQGQHGITVYAPVFRNPYFTELFSKIDSTRGLEKHLFVRVGRYRLPRICGRERIERSPPANLPSSYYQADYLIAMDKGLVEKVPIALEE